MEEISPHEVAVKNASSGTGTENGNKEKSF
jgi:hypothetical protein